MIVQTQPDSVLQTSRLVSHCVPFVVDDGQCFADSLTARVLSFTLCLESELHHGGSTEGKYLRYRLGKAFQTPLTTTCSLATDSNGSQQLHITDQEPVPDSERCRPKNRSTDGKCSSGWPRGVTNTITW